MRMREIFVYLSLLLVFILPLQLHAASVEQVQPARYQALLTELRCLVCQNQDLLESHAPLADDLKEKVKQLMQAGHSDDEIRQYLVKRYGDFILFKPRLQSTTWVLWFGPVIFLVVGCVAAIVWVRRSHGAS